MRCSFHNCDNEAKYKLLLEVPFFYCEECWGKTDKNYQDPISKEIGRLEIPWETLEK